LRKRTKNIKVRTLHCRHFIKSYLLNQTAQLRDSHIILEQLMRSNIAGMFCIVHITYTIWFTCYYIY